MIYESENASLLSLFHHFYVKKQFTELCHHTNKDLWAEHISPKPTIQLHRLQRPEIY